MQSETAYHYKGLPSAVKHISGEVMIWSFVQPKDLATLQTINVSVFCLSILESDMRTADWLKLGHAKGQYSQTYQQIYNKEIRRESILL